MCTTDRPDAAGVVVLPDVRGLHPFYEELAVRFGEAGINATAIDYYGRTAGVGPRGDDFDLEPHFERVSDETVAADTAVAVAHLRSEESGRSRAVFTVGFCFGGRMSFNMAAGDLGLAGVIGFYGRVAEAESGDPSAPVRLAARYSCPLLGLFGGADASVSREDVDAFRRALDGSAIPNEIVMYDGAPHSFFDRTFEANAAASADAWARLMRFVEANG